MESQVAIPALVTVSISVVGVLVSVLQLKEHPRARQSLLLVLLIMVGGMIWYGYSSIKSGDLNLNRIQADKKQRKDLDAKIAAEAQDIVENQHKIDEAKQQAELFEAQRRAEEAERQRDLAAEERLQEQQHVEALQQASKQQTIEDVKRAIVGNWNCGPLKYKWVFRADGTVSLPLGSARFEVMDATHVNVIQMGIPNVYQLDLSGSQPYLSWHSIFSCRKQQ